MARPGAGSGVIAHVLTSLGAMLRVAFRRARSDWPIVLAAGLTVTIAATLLAAGAMYAAAISTASLHAALGRGSVSDVDVGVSARLDPTAVDRADGLVARAVGAAVGSIDGTILRVARSDTFALPRPAEAGRTPLVTFGYAEAIERHVTLVDGAWPTDAAADSNVVPVAAAVGVARSLGVGVGSVVQVHSRIDPTVAVEAQVVALFRIDDAAEAYWWDDQQILDGSEGSDQYVTYGPLFTTRANLVARTTVKQLAFGWHVFPAFDRLEPGAVDALAIGVRRLPDAVAVALGADAAAQVSTGLPDFLARTQRSLLVSSTGVLLLTLQLTVLGAYAVLLSAGLLIEHRRAGSALLRSRGAGGVRLTQLAFIEGVALVGAAVLVAPWLAAASLRALAAVGSLGSNGPTFAATVTPESYLAAGGAGLLCLAALVLPTLTAGRSVGAVQRSLSRAETRDAGRRLGLDVALVVVTAIGLIQLRRYGAPLTSTVKGTLGLDPLLVATPAIGLAAGSVLALRLVPLVASLIERRAARGAGLVPALGARQLARRPLRYTRSALLLMLALAIGVFSLSYAGTWSTSQRDQASYQVGADVRVIPGRRQGAAPAWELERTYLELPGVRAATPIARSTTSLGSSGAGVSIVALDAASAPAVVPLRADLADRPIATLMAPLAAARPAVSLPALPTPEGVAPVLRLDLAVQVRALGPPGAPAGSSTIGSPDLTPLQGWKGVTASVVVRDARGSLFRFGGESGELGRDERLTVPLGDPTAAGSGTGSASGSAAGSPGGSPASAGTGAGPVRFTYPLELVAVELAIATPPGLSSTNAAIDLRGVDAATGTDGGWQPVALGSADGWRAVASYYREPLRPVPVHGAGGAIEVATDPTILPELGPFDEAQRSLVVTFEPAAVGAAAQAVVPLVATDAMLAATHHGVGDELDVDIGGAVQRFRIVGAVRGFPTVEPGGAAMIVDLPTFSLLRLATSGSIDVASEWWLSRDPAASTALASALERSPILSASVVDRADRAALLETDPVAVGILGSLAIGFVAAAALAVIGFAIGTAVSARERMGEFALLRALGLSARQLSAWLALESAVLAGISLVAGTGLGLAMAWVALPFVTVTQQATTPFPPVDVQVPWGPVAGLEVVAVAALIAAVVVVAWLMRASAVTSALRLGED